MVKRPGNSPLCYEDCKSIHCEGRRKCVGFLDWLWKFCWDFPQRLCTEHITSCFHKLAEDQMWGCSNAHGVEWYLSHKRKAMGNCLNALVEALVTLEHKSYLQLIHCLCPFWAGTLLKLHVSNTEFKGGN